MFLETENLIIRSLDIKDGQVFATMAGDGSLFDVGFDADCKAWMDQWIKEAIALCEIDDPKKEYLAYAVCLKETNALIGSVGCSFYADLDEVGITYFIGDTYRGHGYAAESIKAYTDYFFSQYPIHRLIATIREANIASWKTIEKCSYSLTEKKMYKDIKDEAKQLYRFYEFKPN